MRRSFNNTMADFQGLTNFGVRLTMKNGATIDIDDYKIKGNAIYSKNVRKALLNDVDYIELNSRF